MSRRASDDPFFDPRNDWKHPSQSIATNMRQRSAASSRADQAKMMTEQHIAMNLRELFVKQQHEYGALETRAAGYQERIAALEAQLAKLSSDWQSVTKDVAVASDNLLGADGVREGRADAAAAPDASAAADDVAADEEPAVQRDVRGYTEEHTVPRRTADGAGRPAAAPADPGGGEGAEPISPVADGDDAAAAEMK